MSTNEPQHHTPGPISWPFVVTLALVLAATIAAPNLGASSGEVLAAVGAAGGVGALVYGRQAAKQTNGSLTPRMEEAVARGVARALDAAPPEGATPAGEVYGAAGTEYPRTE